MACLFHQKTRSEKMKNKKLMNVKECSDKKLKRICGGNQWTLGNSKSNVAQCVLSLFKKC
ncbi:EntF family bacteriocin induction factor [Enterococcus avium]|jgi:hypothetical protein|uniref:EntF family bacteriocin induction factor n=1 Tax=Enterococcus avium TaxID=33945 RepID=A0A553S734_ENTAV|nr:EntF family bacteriocin induction factor [Enterococcus avium]TRZ32800.1 EntF family bacteriocin induction factor [Enterococcus avium]